MYRLQQIDSQIDRAKTRLQAIQIILENDTELKEAVDEAGATEKAYLLSEEALRQAERNVQDLRIKMQQIESSLYSSSGHSPKELQDLQNDLAALRRHEASLEDLQLEAMIVCETNENRSLEAKRQLSLVRERVTDKNLGLTQEQNTLQKEIEKLSTERLATSDPIAPTMIAAYDQLRKQKRGLAIATISDKACDACGSTLSAAQIQSARSSSQIAFCPSCGRILYGS